jgi:hypothetical protein
VNTFKLIYVSSGQQTLASVEGVSHERERDVRVGGPAAVISLYKYNSVNGTLN